MFQIIWNRGSTIVRRYLSDNKFREQICDRALGTIYSKSETMWRKGRNTKQGPSDHVAMLFIGDTAVQSYFVNLTLHCVAGCSPDLVSTLHYTICI
jgi:hypothetical protein